MSFFAVFNIYYYGSYGTFRSRFRLAFCQVYNLLQIQFLFRFESLMYLLKIIEWINEVDQTLTCSEMGKMNDYTKHYSYWNNPRSAKTSSKQHTVWISEPIGKKRARILYFWSRLNRKYEGLGRTFWQLLQKEYSTLHKIYLGGSDTYSVETYAKLHSFMLSILVITIQSDRDRRSCLTRIGTPEQHVDVYYVFI